MRDGLADHEVTNSRPDARAGQCIAGKAEFQPAAQSTRRKRQQIRAGSKGQGHLAESVASPLLQLRVLGLWLVSGWACPGRRVLQGSGSHSEIFQHDDVAFISP
jgi:hypothetical protein